MPFTPINTLVGGALLHLSTSNLLTDTGRVLGISGIVDGAILGSGELWRWAIIAGLVVGPALGSVTGISTGYASDPLSGWQAISPEKAILAGLLTGLGSRLGSGCTSGHFLCGVSRGSKRSLIATGTFFSFALLTANLFAVVPATSGAPSYLPVYPTRQETLRLLLAFAGLRLAQSLTRSFLMGQQRVSRLARLLPYLLSGLTFSYGLLISGMADPLKVVSFLKLSPQTFDPSLGMVVLSGVIPNAVHWYNLQKGKVTYPWEKWSVPSRTDIDWKLLTGSAIFGIGWGLVGVCPGPAVVALGSVATAFIRGEAVQVAAKTIIAWAGSMVVGMGLAHFV